jgi:hypothetical protein
VKRAVAGATRRSCQIEHAPSTAFGGGPSRPFLPTQIVQLAGDSEAVHNCTVWKIFWGVVPKYAVAGCRFPFWRWWRGESAAARIKIVNVGWREGFERDGRALQWRKPWASGKAARVRRFGVGSG